MTRRTDRATRVIRASPDRIYQAFVDPDQQREWLPPPGMTAHFDRFEPRVGGRYQLTLRYKDPQAGAGKSSPDADVVEGRFEVLEPDEVIVQTAEFRSDDPDFAGTMTMTWTFHSHDNGTEVEIVASNVPPGISADDHQQGLQSTLANLDGYLAGKAAS